MKCTGSLLKNTDLTYSFWLLHNRTYHLSLEKYSVNTHKISFLPFPLISLWVKARVNTEWLRQNQKSLRMTHQVEDLGEGIAPVFYINYIHSIISSAFAISGYKISQLLM